MIDERLTEDWMVSELLLNKGYTKEQLAILLHTSVSYINSVLNYQHNHFCGHKLRSKLIDLFQTHHKYDCQNSLQTVSAK